MLVNEYKDCGDLKVSCALSGRIFLYQLRLQRQGGNMKQTRALKILLIAMLVLTLIFMLVACNKDKNNNSDDNVELTDDMKQLVEKSREDRTRVLHTRSGFRKSGGSGGGSAEVLFSPLAIAGSFLRPSGS